LTAYSATVDVKASGSTSQAVNIMDLQDVVSAAASLRILTSFSSWRSAGMVGQVELTESGIRLLEKLHDSARCCLLPYYW
jgi:hypothetical protein